MSTGWRPTLTVRPRPSTGYLFVLVAAALWALVTPVARLLLEAGLQPAEIAFWRAAVAWIAFAMHLLLTSLARSKPAAASRMRIARTDLAGIVAFGIFGIAGLYASVALAVAAGGAALASILLYTAPAWVVLVAAPTLGESITRRKVVALALTLGGVAAFGAATGHAGRIPVSALAWGLVAGGCYASLYIVGKVYFGRYPPPVVFFWALPLAALVLWPGVTFAPKDAAAWVAILTVGLLSTYAAYLAYAAGLARLEASRASIVATAEPVMAGALAFAIWGERFSAIGYLGGAMILAAVALMTVGGRETGRGRMPESARPTA